jgi:uridine kinase
MPRLILVGGGSSSGKTYITESIIKAIGEDKITYITLDDYYKDQSDMSMAERMKVNYDHPKAFDWPLMRKQIADLKAGKTIEKPTYDFTTLTRSNKTETIVPKDLIIAEGIMALVDKDLRSISDLRVFISASDERRFLRRIIRDHEERARSFENIINQYFTTVQPMYNEIVYPSSNYADVIVNNDGVENLAVEVLTCVAREQLLKAESGEMEPQAMNDEFSEERLAGVFRETKK